MPPLPTAWSRFTEWGRRHTDLEVDGTVEAAWSVGRVQGAWGILAWSKMVRTRGVCGVYVVRVYASQDARRVKASFGWGRMPFRVVPTPAACCSRRERAGGLRSRSMTRGSRTAWSHMPPCVVSVRWRLALAVWRVWGQRVEAGGCSIGRINMI